jgi:hypothetical protein
MILIPINSQTTAFDYNDTEKNAKTHSNKKTKTESHSADATTLAIVQNSTIMMLVCTVLIGLFGIRREGRKLRVPKQINRPEHGDSENLLHEKFYKI